MTYCGGIGELVEISRIRAKELSVQWQIKDFLSLAGGSDDYYTSPIFRLGVGRWHLRLRPNWERETQNPESGWVRLVLVRCGPNETFYFSVGIRGSRGVEKSREGEMDFSVDNFYRRWDDFCSRSELLEPETRLMTNGVLNITCVIKKVMPGTGGLKSSNKCIICWEGCVDAALYRCGHMYTCYVCALKLWEFNSHCPICRKSIQDVLKIYSECT